MMVPMPWLSLRFSLGRVQLSLGPWGFRVGMLRARGERGILRRQPLKLLFQLFNSRFQRGERSEHKLLHGRSHLRLDLGRNRDSAGRHWRGHRTIEVEIAAKSPDQFMNLGTDP